jgi:hypothetical protein
METKTATLSETERNALEFLLNANGLGSVLASEIPDKNEKDVFGNTVAGMRVYIKLEARGFVIITEEDPFELEDGSEFQYTNEVYITDAGREALKITAS